MHGFACFAIVDPVDSAWHWEDYIGAHEAKQEILAHEQNLQVAALLRRKQCDTVLHGFRRDS